jgi:hypothetical protein
LLLGLMLTVGGQAWVLAGLLVRLGDSEAGRLRLFGHDSILRIHVIYVGGWQATTTILQCVVVRDD